MKADSKQNPSLIRVKNPELMEVKNPDIKTGKTN